MEVHSLPSISNCDLPLSIYCRKLMFRLHAMQLKKMVPMKVEFLEIVLSAFRWIKADLNYDKKNGGAVQH